MAKNRSELVAEVAGKAGTSQAAVNSVLDALFEVFETSVAAGEKITIPGWLAVERTDRAARTGRNPQTGETIQIAAGPSGKPTAGPKPHATARTVRATARRSRLTPVPCRSRAVRRGHHRDDGGNALALFRSNRFAGLLMALACWVAGNAGL